MDTFFGSNKIENSAADLSLRLQEGELSPNEVLNEADSVGEYPMSS
jgi:hypothetical protein